MKTIKNLFVMALAIVFCSFAYGGDFYDIQCTYRVLNDNFDVLRKDSYGEDQCGPVFAKIRDIGGISDEIMEKYKPSDYVLAFIIDQVDGGKAVAATFYLKRKVDGKATKQFAIMFESGDGPWDMHTLGLNSIIALGQAVNYMGHTCEDDPKCDLFNANVSLVRRTIRSKKN